MSATVPRPPSSAACAEVLQSVRHVVWDWNGTLFDDAWLCVEIMDRLLRRYGLPGLTPERYAATFDFPVRDYYRRLGFDFARTPFERVGAEFIEEYERRKLECRLRRGARAAITRLARRGIGQTVISAYREDTLRQLLRHFGLDRYMEAIVGAHDIYAAGKGERALEWFRAAGWRGCEVLVIGDTTHDAAIARAMGAQCRLVLAGHQSAARLAATGWPVVRTLRELGI
ncbi:MAG: HAD family hydrolase [Kiritimatiellae bacterium]|nr:HAD family hydrolase [Kiritimatiellia bacterium]